MRKITIGLLLLLAVLPSTVMAYTMCSVLPDTGLPTLNSATIPSAGTSITLNFSETVTCSTCTGWTIDMSGGTGEGMSYSSGSGSANLVYTITGRTINSGETGTVAYTQPGNGIEDVAANDLATIASASVTNNSTQSGGGTLLVGDNTSHATNLDYTFSTREVLYRSTGYTASASGTVAKGYFLFGTGTQWGDTCKMLVYDGSKNLMTGGTSTEKSGLSSVNTWAEFTFTSGPSITSGQTYYLGITCSNDMSIKRGSATAGWYLHNDTTGSYASPPTGPLTQSGNMAYDDIGIYVVN